MDGGGGEMGFGWGGRLAVCACASKVSSRGAISQFCVCDLNCSKPNTEGGNSKQKDCCHTLILVHI